MQWEDEQEGTWMTMADLVITWARDHTPGTACAHLRQVCEAPSPHLHQHTTRDLALHTHALAERPSCLRMDAASLYPRAEGPVASLHARVAYNLAPLSLLPLGDQVLHAVATSITPAPCALTRCLLSD